MANGRYVRCGGARHFPSFSTEVQARLETQMSHPMRGNVADKMAVQLLEADVEAGFALVDDAWACRASGQLQFASRVRQDAVEIIADVERRLQRLGDSESRPFHCLITELRNEIAALEREPTDRDGPAARPGSDDALPES